MSKLPKDWSMKPLGAIATLQRGFDLPVQNRCEGSVHIFAANGPVGTHTTHKVKGPGVVTGRSGTLGKVHFVEKDFWPLNTSLWVKDFHGNDPKWVCRLLSWMRLEQFTRGAGVPTLNRNLVHVIEVPHPPLAEQKRIAGMLDAVDSMRAKRRESLDQLGALVQSSFLTLFGDPIGNPMEWEMRTLGELAKNKDGNRVPLKKGDRDKMDGAYPYYGASGIIDYVNDFLFDGDHLLIGEDGANLMARTTPIAFIAKGRYWVNNHAHVLAANGKAELPFLETFINSIDVKPFLSGTAQPKLNQKKLNQINVPYPPLDLQRRFTAIVGSIEQQKARQRAHLAELDALFATVQYRAFSGELKAA